MDILVKLTTNSLKNTIFILFLLSVSACNNNDDTIITDPIPKDDKSFETWQKNHNTEYQLEMQNSISRNKNLFIKKKSSQ